MKRIASLRMVRLMLSFLLLAGASGALAGDAADVWASQPRLVEQAARRIESTAQGGRVYLISVAAMGSQDIFAREAKLALRVLRQRYGARARMAALLSNGREDRGLAPFATLANIGSLADSIASDFDPERDVAVIYLTSHGSPQAELATDIPGERNVPLISAARLAEELAHSRVRRRVIIVSACFAGSWAAPLANEDTILVAAAAPDRSSFGCSDQRKLTFFGEALLQGRLGDNVAWSEAFAQTRKTIARMEAAGRLTPSRPDAYVGARMREFWAAKPR